MSRNYGRPILLLTVLAAMTAGASAPAVIAAPRENLSATKAAAPRTVSLDELAHELGERTQRVPEFKLIREIAERLGVRAWLFGGTAAAYGHYVNWDLKREHGDRHYQPDRFDYDYTNIFRSTQDLDIVIDGAPAQAAALTQALSEAYPHLQGSKSAWEVRLLKQDMGDKLAILNNPDFLNQHSDSNSTGMIEVTRAPAGETAVRDVMDWDSGRPHFLRDIRDGQLHYYFNPKHGETRFFKEGRNPAILSVIRYLTKAFQYQLEIRPEDREKLRKVVEEFKPDGPELKDSYVQNWLLRRDNGRKLMQNALNMEFAWNTLEELGLRKKLMKIENDPGRVNSLAWWLNREPLRSEPLGQGTGKTARELGLDVVAHETGSFLAYESITKSPTGEPNVFISRSGAAGEAAAYGDGFYVREGRVGARGSGITIRFHLAPEAREGTDFTREGDYLVVRNRKALKVIPESLNWGLEKYFTFVLSSGGSFDKNDRAQFEKLNRRVAHREAALAPGEAERAILQAMRASFADTKGFSGEGWALLRGRYPAIEKAVHDWFASMPEDEFTLNYLRSTWMLGTAGNSYLKALGVTRQPHLRNLVRAAVSPNGRSEAYLLYDQLVPTSGYEPPLALLHEEIRALPDSGKAWLLTHLPADFGKDWVRTRKWMETLEEALPGAGEPGKGERFLSVLEHAPAGDFTRVVQQLKDRVYFGKILEHPWPPEQAGALMAFLRTGTRGELVRNALDEKRISRLVACRHRFDHLKYAGGGPKKAKLVGYEAAALGLLSIPVIDSSRSDFKHVTEEDPLVTGLRNARSADQMLKEFRLAEERARAEGFFGRGWRMRADASRLAAENLAKFSGFHPTPTQYLAYRANYLEDDLTSKVEVPLIEAFMSSSPGKAEMLKMLEIPEIAPQGVLPLLIPRFLQGKPTQEELEKLKAHLTRDAYYLDRPELRRMIATGIESNDDPEALLGLFKSAGKQNYNQADYAKIVEELASSHFDKLAGIFRKGDWARLLTLLYGEQNINREPRFFRRVYARALADAENDEQIMTILSRNWPSEDYVTGLALERQRELPESARTPEDVAARLQKVSYHDVTIDAIMQLRLARARDAAEMLAIIGSTLDDPKVTDAYHYWKATSEASDRFLALGPTEQQILEYRRFLGNGSGWLDYARKALPRIRTTDGIMRLLATDPKVSLNWDEIAEEHQQLWIVAAQRLVELGLNRSNQMEIMKQHGTQRTNAALLEALASRARTASELAAAMDPVVNFVAPSFEVLVNEVWRRNFGRLYALGATDAELEKMPKSIREEFQWYRGKRKELEKLEAPSDVLRSLGKDDEENNHTTDNAKRAVSDRMSEFAPGAIISDAEFWRQAEGQHSYTRREIIFKAAVANARTLRDFFWAGEVATPQGVSSPFGWKRDPALVEKFLSLGPTATDAARWMKQVDNSDMNQLILPVCLRLSRTVQEITDCGADTALGYSKVWKSDRAELIRAVHPVPFDALEVRKGLIRLGQTVRAATVMEGLLAGARTAEEFLAILEPVFKEPETEHLARIVDIWRRHLAEFVALKPSPEQVDAALKRLESQPEAQDRLRKLLARAAAR